MPRPARRPGRMGKAAVQASVGIGTFLVTIVAASPACWGPQDVSHHPSAGFVAQTSVDFRLGVKPRGLNDLRRNFQVVRDPTLDRHHLVVGARCTMTALSRRQSLAFYGDSSGPLSEEIRLAGIRRTASGAAAATRVPLQRTCPVSPLPATSVLLHDEPVGFTGLAVCLNDRLSRLEVALVFIHGV